MIAFIVGTISTPGYIFGDRAPAPMGDGRVCVGIQTRIAEHLCQQGGISVSFPVRCGYRGEHGQCYRDAGHAGCHAFCNTPARQP